MDSMQEEQTGSRETEKREVWQNRQSEGNKAARRLFTAAPNIWGACGLPFGMLSQLLLKTGLLWKRQGPQTVYERDSFPLSPAALTKTVYTNLIVPRDHSPDALCG